MPFELADNNRGGLYGPAAATALEDLPYDARGILSGLYQVCCREGTVECLEADTVTSKVMPWVTCSQQCFIGHSYLPLLMAGEASFGESGFDTESVEIDRLTSTRFGAGPPVLISECEKHHPGNPQTYC